MNGNKSDNWNFEILEPGANEGYLPLPIPAKRDFEISTLLREVIEQEQLVRFKRLILEGHGLVLMAFAERMASAAVRNHDQEALRLGLIALLLSWQAADSREPLAICPLFYDAARRMELDLKVFFASIRLSTGDQILAPFIEFGNRSERNMSLTSMGYAAGEDDDGFRYLRNW